MSNTFTITKPISIFPGTKQDGTPNRRLVISVTKEELQEIPAALFAVKVSQSSNPAKRGSLRFKYFAFKLNETTPWSDAASTNFNVATPVEEIKTAVIAALVSQPELKVQFTVNMPGKFANIVTSDGPYSIFDFNEAPDGNLGYYLKGGSVVTVEFTEAIHQNNSYYRLKLSAPQTSPEELFQRGGKAKVFGQEDGVAASAGSVFAGTEEPVETGGAIW